MRGPAFIISEEPVGLWGIVTREWESEANFIQI